MSLKKLGSYEIHEQIGSGGMATVYRAFQPSMERHVAIKVIRSAILTDSVLRDRFQREARLIARLEHPHLLPIYDFDGDHDPPYIVMRYMSGGSVDDLLRLAQKRRPEIGRTTVYRTLKLLQAAGLAQELDLQGETRFEREYKRQHHDHFIRNSCHAIFEFSSPDIERIQDEIAADIGFVIDGHRHHIFGLCRRCATKPVQREEQRR